MIRVIRFAILLLMGCTGGGKVGGDLFCTRTELDPATSPPDVGLDTVLEMLDDYHPVRVVWDGRTMTDSTSVLSLRIEPTDDTFVSVQYADGGCDERISIGTGLYLLTSFSVTIGDNDVTAEIEGGIEVFGDDLARVHLSNVGPEGAGFATLSDAWYTAAGGASGSASDDPYGWFLGLSGFLDRVEIQVDPVDSSAFIGGWYGHAEDSTTSDDTAD